MSHVILKPYRISNIDTNKIVYYNMKEGSTKKILYLKYKDNNRDMRLTFQTPSLYNKESAIKKNGFYELNIPLYGKDPVKTQSLINFFRQLDKKFITDAKKFGSVWFGKSKNITYKSIIRSTPNLESIYKNGTIRVKIMDTESFKTTLLKNNETGINPDEIKADHYVKMILECYALWITKDGFGLYLKPILLSFTPIQFNYNYSLLEDSDNENQKSSDNDDDDILDTEIQHIEENYDIDTSNIEFPKNINILDNNDSMVVESNLISELVQSKQAKLNSHTNITSEYINDDDNITTYQNYVTEEFNNKNSTKKTINMNLETLDNTTSSFDSDDQDTLEGKVNSMDGHNINTGNIEDGHNINTGNIEDGHNINTGNIEDGHNINTGNIEDGHNINTGNIEDGHNINTGNIEDGHNINTGKAVNILDSSFNISSDSSDYTNYPLQYTT